MPEYPAFYFTLTGALNGESSGLPNRDSAEGIRRWIVRESPWRLEYRIGWREFIKAHPDDAAAKFMQVVL